MDKVNTSQIEFNTRGQAENDEWFRHRKCVITASIGHDGLNKMKKVKKLAGGYINMYSLNEKIAGRTFTNPDIPALEYGRDMEPEALQHFIQQLRTQHKNVVVSSCGLFLDHEMAFVGASPDGIVTCSCCDIKWCLEIKCPYSIYSFSTLSPEAKLTYLIKDDNDAVTINRSHRYYAKYKWELLVLARHTFMYGLHMDFLWKKFYLILHYGTSCRVTSNHIMKSFICSLLESNGSNNCYKNGHISAENIIMVQIHANSMVMGSNPHSALLEKCLKTSFSGQPMPCEGNWAVSLVR